MGVYSGREGYILGGWHIGVENGGIFWEGGGLILGGSQSLGVEKWGIFWEGGVDSGRVAYSD